MSVDGSTQIFGVIGDPITQIKTPDYINTIFADRGMNAICVPFHVSQADFPSFWQGAKGLKNIAGFGITVPHKKQAHDLCASVSSSAEKLGVVNVVKRTRQGDFHGENFDGLSFVNGLKAEGLDPSKHRVFVYGAGGAATAICLALIESGVKSITIQNRTVENAIKLVDLLKNLSDFSPVYYADEFDKDASMIINASCLGMTEHDPLPIDPGLLKPIHTVVEVVAKPEITPLLKEAGKIGCTIHSGIHMIVHQMDIIADLIEGA